MKTALNATRLAIAAFIIPYIFAYSPIMLFIGDDVNAINVIRVVITSFGGMFLIAAGLSWLHAPEAEHCAPSGQRGCRSDDDPSRGPDGCHRHCDPDCDSAYQVISEKRHAATA